MPYRQPYASPLMTDRGARTRPHLLGVEQEVVVAGEGLDRHLRTQSCMLAPIHGLEYARDGSNTPAVTE